MTTTAAWYRNGSKSHVARGGSIPDSPMKHVQNDGQARPSGGPPLVGQGRRVPRPLLTEKLARKRARSLRSKAPANDPNQPPLTDEFSYENSRAVDTGTFIMSLSSMERTTCDNASYVRNGNGNNGNGKRT